MKNINIYGVMLGLAVMVVCIFLFFGFITTIKQSFNKPYKSENLESSRSRSTQREKMREIRARQKELMRNNRQKLRDAQRMQRR